LASQFDVRLFRNSDFEQACRTARDEALRMAETQIINDIEENLPDEEEPSEWNWEAMAKGANARWGLNLRDRDLKKVGRDHVAEMLLEQAQEAIEKVDLSRGQMMLEADFSLRTVQAWVRSKFGLEIAIDEIRPLEPEALIKLICDRAEKAYDEKESEYPVMAGLYRFSSGAGQARIDRELLVAWARQRFDVDLSLEDLKNKQRDEIREVLLRLSRASQQRAAEALDKVREKVEGLYRGREPDLTTAAVAGGNGSLDSLVDWFNQSLHSELSVDEIGALNREQLERALIAAVEDRYHPEMRRMERSLLLQIVDTSWKDHLLVMDHLRSSVGLKGYAQMDPKVEYKREGMRLFERMWESIGERTTDLIFKMEQLDEGFVGSTWTETAAVHEQAASTSEIANMQQDAINASQSEGERREPIRHRGHRVGRNDPCPCGSGKKYKSCCMRKQDVA
jgi:preprotein translocase subunit SecA